MMGSSGFPIDIVLFGMVAAFLVLRLRSILGRRSGFERQTRPFQPVPTPASAPVIDGKAEPVGPQAKHIAPDPTTPIGQTLLRFRSIDRRFDPEAFLDGAEKAFHMIVVAFANGDRVMLKNLLSAETYRSFEQAIADREAAGHVQVTEVRAIHTVAIEGAELHGTVAQVVVRFVSDQVNMTRDRENKPIVGTDAVTEITDLWSFERDLGSPDPTWRLVAARSA